MENAGSNPVKCRLLPFLPRTSTEVRHNREVKEATRHTFIRHSEEPKLEVGDTVEIKEGMVGVVLARFTPCAGKPNETHYIVESGRA